MKDFIKTLEIEFQNVSNTTIALGQKAYMRNLFDFYGVMSKQRREIQKPFLEKKYLPKKQELNEIIKTLWNKTQREFQYFGQELVLRYSKCFEKEDIVLLEFMVTHKSWWDTVDFIATKLISEYFKTYPEQIKKYIQKWLKSDNIWLKRSAIMFQQKYKTELDTHLLSFIINSLLGSEDFFINKAIGWILREYGKTNPQWVINFVNETELNSLSRKEALRLIM